MPPALSDLTNTPPPPSASSSKSIHSDTPHPNTRGSAPSSRSRFIRAPRFSLADAEELEANESSPGVIVTQHKHTSIKLHGNHMNGQTQHGGENMQQQNQHASHNSRMIVEENSQQDNGTQTKPQVQRENESAIEQQVYQDSTVFGEKEINKNDEETKKVDFTALYDNNLEEKPEIAVTPTPNVLVDNLENNVTSVGIASSSPDSHYQRTTERLEPTDDEGELVAHMSAVSLSLKSDIDQHSSHMQQDVNPKEEHDPHGQKVSTIHPESLGPESSYVMPSRRPSDMSIVQESNGVSGVSPRKNHTYNMSSPPRPKSPNFLLPSRPSVAAASLRNEIEIPKFTRKRCISQGEPVRPKSPKFLLKSRPSVISPQTPSDEVLKPPPTKKSSFLSGPVRPKSPNFLLSSRSSVVGSVRSDDVVSEGFPRKKSFIRAGPVRPRSPNFKLPHRPSVLGIQRQEPAVGEKILKKAKWEGTTMPKTPNFKLHSSSSSSFKPEAVPVLTRKKSGYVGPTRPKSPNFRLAAEASLPKHMPVQATPKNKRSKVNSKWPGEKRTTVPKSPAFRGRMISVSMAQRRAELLAEEVKKREAEKEKERKLKERRDRWVNNRTIPKSPKIVKVGNKPVLDEPKNKSFVARPMPKFRAVEVKQTQKSQAHAKVNKEGGAVKIVRNNAKVDASTRREMRMTIATPFELQSLQQHELQVARMQLEKQRLEEEEERRRVFRPVELKEEILDGPTFVPGRSSMPLTQPKDLLPHIHERKARTAAFMRRQRERMEEMDRLKEIAQMRRDESELEEAIRYREEHKFKPRPIPKSHYEPEVGSASSRWSPSFGDIIAGDTLQGSGNSNENVDGIVTVGDDSPESAPFYRRSGILDGIRKSLSPLLGSPETLETTGEGGNGGK